MNKNTQNLIAELKDAGQDFELYPTTRQMIADIYAAVRRERDLRDGITVLDIGCGTCNFKTYFDELSEREKGGFFQKWIKTYYVMEKSEILLHQLPKEAAVIGTDFNQNTLIDKKADVIFCNPPYSEYVQWTSRIIRESRARFIYLVIPQRWKENAEIQQALKDTMTDADVLGSYDFMNAERAARAKVDIIAIDKGCRATSQAFDDWYDATFKLDDKKTNPQEEREKIRQELISGRNKVELLVNGYNAKLSTLHSHFSAIAAMGAEVLESIGVNKAAVKKALQMQIEGLKNLYWRIAFDELDEITARLTSDTKNKLYSRFEGLLTADFTAANIYALVVWVCKNAAAYYDSQLIDLFKKFTEPENIKLFKSNQRVFEKDDWGRWRRDTATHYCLSNRIICHSLYFKKDYSWGGAEIDERHAQTIVDDLCAVAHNLGFFATDKEKPTEFGKKYYIWMAEGKPLIEYKVYQNGNTHMKLDKDFAIAMNVEVSRLLGWIRNKEDIAQEFPADMARGAEKYWNVQAVPCIGNTQLLIAE